ncbi:MAG: N-acyl-D-amino-acid deacylase family protein [Calditrichia bacterium]
MKALLPLCAALLLLQSCANAPQPISADIWIKNAILVDGSGTAPQSNQQLLIRDGKIVAVGKTVNALATRVIDAKGRVVAPGIIDPHAHGNPLGKASFENFIAMGVTTIVLGLDGSSTMTKDLGAWMDNVQEKQPHLNIATFVGHGTIRRMANVVDTSHAAVAQIDTMKEYLSEAFAAGAFGMSTGLEYVPGIYASEEELIELAKVVGANDALIMSHLRSEDDDTIEPAIDELLRQGEHCKVHVSHMKIVYGKGEARANEILASLASARKSGIRVSADVYPYTASYTGIGIVFPSWAKKTDQFEEAVKKRPQELREYLHKRVMQRNGPSATLFGTGDYKGKTLAEVAKEQNRDFVDVLLELGPRGASGAYFVMDKELQDVFLNDPEIMICTDGSPGMRHPRGYGSYSKIIEEYVQRDKTLTLEQAIYKLTHLPAKTIGLTDRGLIAVGMAADLIIFDPANVRSKTEWSDPYQLAEGFDIVIVNGKVARENGELSESKAGRMLRKATGG